MPDHPLKELQRNVRQQFELGSRIAEEVHALTRAPVSEDDGHVRIPIEEFRQHLMEILRANDETIRISSKVVDNLARIMTAAE